MGRMGAQGGTPCHMSNLKKLVQTCIVVLYEKAVLEKVWG